MADPVTIALIAGSAAAASSLMSTGQQRAQAETQARTLEVEAGAARTQAGLESEALGRQQRRQFGESRAAGAELGLLESVTFGDLYRESAAAAQLDRAMVEYQGETQARGLLSEAAIARASKKSWVAGALEAAGAGFGTYMAAGGTLPSAKPKVIKGTSMGAPSPVYAGSPRIVRNVGR